MLTADPRLPAAAGAVVRPAMPGDAMALAGLCAAHAAYERLAYDTDGHAARLAQVLQSGRLQAWLAVQDGRAVGYASATLDCATLTARPFVHLDCLYLDPAARGQGLGLALLDAVVGHARALGCAQLQWQTPEWNERAIRFYDRLGATRLAKQRYTLACEQSPCPPAA